MRFLQNKHRITVDILPQTGMGGMLRHFDSQRGRLMLSEMLPLHSRVFQIAHQIGLLDAKAEIDAILADSSFTSADAEKLARVALANYYAAAVMMPYSAFRKAAVETRYDINVLQHRFGASFEQVAHRLTTLRRPGEEGIPFHLIRVDIAGNISKRFSASGIHIARFGAACPRWNVYDAFATPGLMRVQISRMPDGASFFCVARTLEPAGRFQTRGGLPHRIGTLALGLGCALHHAKDIVYADGLDIDDAKIATPSASPAAPARAMTARTGQCPRSTSASTSMKTAAA